MNNEEANNAIEGFGRQVPMIPPDSDTAPSDGDRSELLQAHRSESHKSSDPSSNSSNDLGTGLYK